MSKQSMRVFVAVPLPKEIVETLERWTRDNRDRLSFRKWTHPQDYHITLQFLGETPTDKIEGLRAVLEGVEIKPMALKLNGIGVFGSPTAPRVLWAAVSGDLIGLNSLHASVVQATRSQGYIPEERPYAAHITLARNFNGPNEFTKDVLDSAPSGTEWLADRFTLMRTHMNASPMYEVIGSYPFR